MNSSNPSRFRVHLAQHADEIEAAQKLRYDVFVRELGGSGALVDHSLGIEKDHFDAHCDHLLLTDLSRDAIVGVYRLMRRSHAANAGSFYSAGEYDLTPLLDSDRRLLELGRSCLHKDYRGGMAMFHLWSGLASYVAAHEIDILFGVASFHGTDADALAGPLSLLHHRHLAPQELRVRARAEAFLAMDILPEDTLDRKAAMRAVPALIKAYLRLGGRVGEGAFIDHAFNTTDVCLILDTAQMNDRQARLYQGSEG